MEEPRPKRPALLPEERVDHFQVVRLIGRGGMGEVYLARDTSLGRRVALKVIRRGRLPDREARERFLYEARVTARFSHPNIVTVYAVGEHEGLPYVALEHVEGQTLRQRATEERFTPRQAARVVLGVASAVAEAHRHGVLHRDLKPENVIIAADGRPRVLDFGLARPPGAARRGAASTAPPEAEGAEADDVGEGHTTTPVAPNLPDGDARDGTPRYMAPEQWSSTEAIEATDSWGLGLLLFELIDGRHPIAQGTLRETFAQICSDEPIQPLMKDGVPPEISTLVAQCLEKDPRRRPSAEEIAATLASFLARDPAESEVGESPFLGLFPFSERHAGLYTGREREVAACVERLRSEPVIAVVGPSGVGKSSFVRAGLVPRLKEQGPWTVVDVRPGARPFAALADGLSQAASTAIRRGSTRSEPQDEATSSPAAVEETLGRSPLRLAAMLAELAERRGGRLLLLVDQLEEVFTSAEDGSPQARARFLEAVLHGADDPLGLVRVVVTLREDFLGQLAAVPMACSRLFRVMALGNLGADSLTEIAERTAARGGCSFDDPALPRELAEAVEGEPASLPLLQLAGLQLWHQRDQGRRLLTRAAFAEMGGVAGALARHTDAVLEGLAPSEVDLARQLVLRLVTPERTRRVLPRSRLLEGLGAAAERVLDHLVASRIVLARMGRPEGESDAELVLVHDSLLTTWRRLERWMAEDRDELAFVDEVTQAAELWNRRGRPDDEVWLGPALDAALGRARRCPGLGDEALAFLEAGRRRAGRAARRRRWVVAGVSSLGLLVATGLVALALRTSEGARVARAEQARAEAARGEAQAREAEALLEGARAALGRGDVLEARARLRSSLEASDSVGGRVLLSRLAEEPALARTILGSWALAAAASPDGSVVAAGLASGEVFVVDADAGEAAVIGTHAGQVNALAFAPSGDRLASAGAGGKIRLWDLETRASTVLEGRGGPIWSLSFSPDGGALAAAAQDGSVLLWTMPDGGSPRLLGVHEGRARAVTFEADGRVASAGHDGTVRLWDPSGRDPPRTLRGHEEGVVALRASPEGGLLASGGHDGTIRLWDPETGEAQTLSAGQGSVTSLAFAAAGRVLASGGSDGSIRLWETATGHPLGALEGHEGAVWGLDSSRGRALLASAGQDGTVRLWNVEGRRDRSDEPGHDGAVLGLAFSPDGSTIATAGDDGTVRLWDGSRGTVEAVLRGHTARVRSVAFSPDGSLLASTSHDGTLRLWDVATREERQVLHGHSDGVTGVAFHPDGRTVASGSWDGTTRIWDVASGARRAVLEGRDDWVSEVAFSPDGSRLAAAGHRSVTIWRMPEGVAAATLRGHEEPVTGIAFGSGGETLVSAAMDGVTELWDLATGASTEVARDGVAVYWLDVDPRSDRIGEPLAGGLALIRGAAGGGEPVRLVGHRGDVNCLRFSPDGQRVATSGDDGTLRLWEAGSGRPLWRTVGVVGDPPCVATHEGWVPARAASGERPSCPLWLEGAVDDADQVADLPEAGVLCVLTRDGRLVRWDVAARRQLWAEEAPSGAGRVEAVEGGCLVSGPSGAWLRADDAAPLRLASTEALAAAGDGLLAVVAGGRLLTFGSDGARRDDAEVGSDVTALALGPDGAIVGRTDGRVEVVASDDGVSPTAGAGDRASAVTALVAGPAGTVALGRADGRVELWQAEGPRRLAEARLHGPVSRLVVRGQRLVATSALGRFTVIDLAPLSWDRETLLRTLRREIPVLWQGGRPVTRQNPADASP